MEQILTIGRDQLVRLAGHGCEAGEGLVARSVFGLARSRDGRLAQLHLATCPRCGAMYERLDLWREKVAAALPVPVAAGAQEHGRRACGSGKHRGAAGLRDAARRVAGRR